MTWQKYKRTAETETVWTRPIPVQVRLKKKTAQRRGSGHRVLAKPRKYSQMMAAGREKQSINKQVFFIREMVGGRLGEQMASVNQTPWFSESFFF